MPEPVSIGGVDVGPGERARVRLDVARLPSGEWLSLTIEVLNGAEPGPGLWLDAAIHGDELNGLEVIHRLLDALDPGKLKGLVLAVPIVNVFGFVQQTRYLPDRRDLNRSFPGSQRGSLAARIARLFIKEIVERCQYGLDFHTGSMHRTNLPQIRADLRDQETHRLARAFGAPVMLHAKTIKGSLRAAARKRGKQILVYEAGEPLRFDQEAIRVGVEGTLRVLAALGMRPGSTEAAAPSLQADGSCWLRAARSGILHMTVDLGDHVHEGDCLATISDVTSSTHDDVRSPEDGVVIGFTNNPLIHQGDAMIHLAIP